MKRCPVCKGTFTHRTGGAVYCSKICSGRAANLKMLEATRRRTMRRTLVRHPGSPLLYRFTLEEERGICEEYQRGRSTSDLAARHSASRQIIKDVLTRHSVGIRTKRTAMLLHYAAKDGRYQPGEVRYEPGEGRCRGCGMPGLDEVCDACSLAV